MTSKFIHCDCDCFFAAIEMRDDPALRGLPVAVGGAQDRRGVIATCNYEARQYGVHSAMASSTARRLCRDLIIIPPNMEKYVLASQEVGEIFRAYTDLIEPLSLDEAFLDVTDSTACKGRARHEITVGKQFVKLKFNDFVSTTVEHVAFSPDLDGYRNLCRAGFERGNKPVRLLGLGVRLRGSSVLTQLELPLAHSA